MRGGTIYIRCVACDEVLPVSGISAGDIVKKIDLAGWEQYSSSTGVCPFCLDELADDDDLLGEPE